MIPIGWYYGKVKVVLDDIVEKTESIGGCLIFFFDDGFIQMCMHVTEF
jgi:hypothetical protein